MKICRSAFIPALAMALVLMMGGANAEEIKGIMQSPKKNDGFSIESALTDVSDVMVEEAKKAELAAKKKREAEAQAAAKRRAEAEKAKKEKEQQLAKNKGDKLVIPESVYVNHDLSFLEGCWVTDAHESGPWSSPNKDFSRSRYCFDCKGRGQLTITEGNGKQYRGKITGFIRDEKVRVFVIEAERAYSSSQTDHCYSPSSIYFKGTEENTKGFYVVRDPNDPSMVGYHETVLRRD